MMNEHDIRRELREREMALVLMNRRLVAAAAGNGSSTHSMSSLLQQHQQQQAQAQQGSSSTQGPSSSLLDLYSNRQDVLSSLLTASSSSNTAPTGAAGGVGRSSGGGTSTTSAADQTQRFFADAWNFVLPNATSNNSAARRGSTHTTGSGGATTDPFRAFSLDLSSSGTGPTISPTVLPSIFGRGGSASTGTAAGVSCNHNSAGTGLGSLGLSATHTSGSTSGNNCSNSGIDISALDSLRVQQMLRDNALMRERILGHSRSSELQVGSPPLPYRRSVLSGNTSNTNTTGGSSGLPISLGSAGARGIFPQHSHHHERLITPSGPGQIPSAQESIMMAHTRFVNGGDTSSSLRSSLQLLAAPANNGSSSGNNGHHDELTSSLLLAVRGTSGGGALANNSNNGSNGTGGGVEAGKFPTCLPVVLAVTEDNGKLSRHQVLLRNQIEAFQATADDLTTHTRGRNKPIKLGQVGIRCRHCARYVPWHVTVGSIVGFFLCFPHTIPVHRRYVYILQTPSGSSTKGVHLLSSISSWIVSSCSEYEHDSHAERPLH